MLLRLLAGSLVRQKRRKVVAVVSVALGTAIAMVVLSLGMNVGDKINRELRSFGANITVVPKSETVHVTLAGADLRAVAPKQMLDQRDLQNLRKIFWRNNLLGY